MGICQCLEITNSELYSTEKNFFENKEEIPEKTKLVKLHRNNKINSNFNNFNKLSSNHKKKNSQSELNRSEILFEDVSIASRTFETLTIDYYQISKNVFELLNTIRMNPDRCLNSLNNLIDDIIPNDHGNGVDIEKELKNNYASVSSNYNNYYSSNNYASNGNINTNDIVGNYLKQNETLKALNEVRDFFIELVENYERNTDLIMWSEKVYLSAYEYLVDVEEKLVGDYEYSKESSSQRISTKMRNNYNCLEFNVNGLQSPEVIVLYLLIENKNRLKNLLIDNYDYGAVCTFPTKNDMRARTLLYLVTKNTQNPLIQGLNPFNGNPQELSIYEPIFQKIKYKHLIVGGSYHSDGFKLYAIFYLNNGENKEEVFNLN